MPSAQQVLFSVFKVAFPALVLVNGLLAQQFEGDGVELAFGIKVTEPLDYTCADQLSMESDGGYTKWIATQAAASVTLNTVAAVAGVVWCCCGMIFGVLMIKCVQVCKCELATGVQCLKVAVGVLFWFASALSTATIAFQITGTIYDAIYLGPLIDQINIPSNVTFNLTVGVTAADVAEAAASEAVGLTLNLTDPVAELKGTVHLKEFTVDSGCGTLRVSAAIIGLLSWVIPLINVALAKFGCTDQCVEDEENGVNMSDVLSNLIITFYPCYYIKKMEDYSPVPGQLGQFLP